MSFAKSILALLVVASLVTLLSKACVPMADNCPWIPSVIDPDFLSTKILEIDLAVMGASLVIVGLISNLEVRDKFKIFFFIPIGLAIIAVILKI